MKMRMISIVTRITTDLEKRINSIVEKRNRESVNSGRMTMFADVFREIVEKGVERVELE